MGDRVTQEPGARSQESGGRRRWFLVALASLLLAFPLPAATYYVTVAGLGGEPEYEQRFTAWAQEIDKLVRSGGGEVTSQVLSGPAATRARVEEALANIAREAKGEDALVLMLIGHGSVDGGEYKMNLPGPDMTASGLATALDRIHAGRQLVVNMTSASGASLDVLKRQNRVVITATKSGTERNATIFARYWVEALRDPAADTDKNEAISALEAFRYAEQKTAQFYETQKRLATEHALIEDTGKGEGVRTPSPENGEGLTAGRFALLRIGAMQKAASTPEKRKLLDRKEDLERQIDQLKYQKAAIPPDQYRKQLAALLLELAKTQEELDK